MPEEMRPEEALPAAASSPGALPGKALPGEAPPAEPEPEPEVLRLLRDRVRAGSRPGQRGDGARIVLAIEGGGMRGTVSAGMALAFHELGFLPAFDAVYGSSAGAISAAWLVSSYPEGLRGWARPDYARTLIRWSALLRRKPVVDVRSLVEVVYQTRFPMDFESVLASDVEWHPLGTDAITGQSTDLRPLVGSPAEVRLALRASAALPFLAGPPVVLRGRRFYDAGLAESVPFRTPVAQGATHIVVLRSRPPRGLVAGDGRAGGVVANGVAAGARPPREAVLLTRTVLRQESQQLREAYLGRGPRTRADLARVAEMVATGMALSVHPPVGGPPVSRLTTDGGVLAAAFEAGRSAVYDLGIPGRSSPAAMA